MVEMMRNYLQHIIRLFIHKWWVFVAGMKLGCSVRRLILHDLSDVFHYASDDFRDSRKKYDWRYWVYIDPDGVIVSLKMPEKYVYEMISDWMASLKEADDTYYFIGEWYITHRKIMTIHADTDCLIRAILYFNGYSSIPPDKHDNADLNELLKQATPEAPYCFWCNSYHPSTQPCLGKRSNW